MIKVSIFYPNTPGCRFDMDYYCNKHMPMVHEKMAGACVANCRLWVAYPVLGINES